MLPDTLVGRTRSQAACACSVSPTCVDRSGPALEDGADGPPDSQGGMGGAASALPLGSGFL